VISFIISESLYIIAMSLIDKLNKKQMKLLQKDIANILKNDVAAVQDITAFASIHMGDFKAIGEYTINRLKIDITKYGIADEQKTDNNDKLL